MNKIALLSSVVIFGFSLFSCNHLEHSKHEESVLTVTQPLKRDTIIHQNYVCQIQAFQHIELRALEKGYLEKIYVDEGQFVKKGQLLFKLNPSIYHAEMLGAKAEKEFVEIEYQTTKELADNKIVSASELALAKAKLDKAKAVLQLANAHLDFTEIRAPFDGIMGRFNVRLGSLLDEGELLTTMSDNRKMWVYFNVSEAAYLTFKMGNAQNKLPEVKLQMANNVMFHQVGVIETIEADFNNETGNIAFRATFNNPDGLLRHGETGNILMPVDFKNALLIPQSATFEVLDKKFVFVVDKNNVVHTRKITVAAELPHLYIVSKGLLANDKVLLEGIRKVKNNQKIKYRTKKAEEALAELHQLFSE